MLVSKARLTPLPGLHPDNPRSSAQTPPNPELFFSVARAPGRGMAQWAEPLWAQFVCSDLLCLFCCRGLLRLHGGDND